MEFGDVEDLTATLQHVLQAPWLGMSIALSIIFAVLIAIMVRQVGRKRRRERRAREAALTRKVDAEAQSLLIDLRQRLWEPPKLFDDHLNGAPTMGVQQAFENDIRSASESILREAGGERGKARALLRARLASDTGAKEGSTQSCAIDIAGVWRQLGVLSLVDGSRDAVAAYARAADLAPDSAQSHLQLGVLQMRAGRLAAAEASFRRQIEVAEKTGDEILRYRGLTMLGDVCAARHETSAALAIYRNVEANIEDLRSRRPKEEQRDLARDLAVTLDRIGDILQDDGEHMAALEAYRRGLAITEHLVRTAGHRDPNLYHDLSVSHERIGDLLERRGNFAAAFPHFKQSLAITRALVRRDPENRIWAWDLSTSYERLADVLHAQGHRSEALRKYRRGLQLAERLVARSGLSEATYQRDLAVSYHKIGSLEAVCGNANEARELLEKGRAIIAQLDRIAHHQAQWRSDLSKFDASLKSLH